MSLRALATTLMASFSFVTAVSDSHAQTMNAPEIDRPAAMAAADAESAVVTPLQLAAEARQAARSLDQTARPGAPRPTPGRVPAASIALGSLYVSTAVLQGLDVHSTLRGMRDGASEANPVMKGLVKNPATFIAMKAGVAAGTIMATRSIAKKNRVTAMLTLAAINAAYGAIVHHNYQVSRRLR